MSANAAVKPRRRRPPALLRPRAGPALAAHGQSGFVLAGVIWFVALLALIAAIMSGWMADAFARAAALQDQTAAEAELLSAADIVAYRMVSSDTSVRGLEIPAVNPFAAAADPAADAAAAPADAAAAFPTGTYIALDDRPYRWRASVLQLQDDGGLYNLNAADALGLGQLLQSYGLDYSDIADLYGRLSVYLSAPAPSAPSLAGANAADPARGQPLRTPWEAFRVPGWGRQSALWSSSRPFARATTASLRLRALNVNTAPRGALFSIGGVDPAAADSILAYRANQPIFSLEDLNLAAGKALVVDPFGIAYAPVGSVRLTLTTRDDPLMHVIVIRVTPGGSAPCQIDYAIALPADAEAQAALSRGDLPALPGAPR